MPERDAIVDVGRLRPGSPASAIVGRADVLLVVLRPTVEDVGAAAYRTGVLRDAGAALVLIGDRPYPVREVAAAVEVPVVGVIAHDVRGALALAGGTGTRALGRTPLVRSAAALAERLAAPGPASVAAAPADVVVADAEHLA
jgi:hypothetical protein